MSATGISVEDHPATGPYPWREYARIIIAARARGTLTDQYEEVTVTVPCGVENPYVALYARNWESIVKSMRCQPPS